MWPLSSRANAYLNVAALLAETMGTYANTLIGVGVFVVSSATVIGPGFGFGFALLATTFLFLVRSGAHFNTSISTAKTLSSWFGLQTRDYFGRASTLYDALFWVLYVGMQMAGAVLAVLTLRYVDKTALLSSTLATVPNGNLAGQNGPAFLLVFLLTLFYNLVYLHVNAPRMGMVVRMVVGPLVIAVAYAGAVIVSIYFGTGSLLNFALDLAVATLVKGESVNTLWISAVAQLVAPIAAVLLFSGGAWMDRICEAKALLGVRDCDHERMSMLGAVMNRVHMARNDPTLALLRPMWTEGGSSAEDTVVLVPATTAGGGDDTAAAINLTL